MSSKKALKRSKAILLAIDLLLLAVAIAGGIYCAGWAVKIVQVSNTGYDSAMMAEAVNNIIDNKGGFSVVSEDFSDSLALPIAGLMTNKDAHDVAKKLGILHKMVSALGCKLDAPFMTMAFMALLVIPSIKISDS